MKKSKVDLKFKAGDWIYFDVDLYRQIKYNGFKELLVAAYQPVQILQVNVNTVWVWLPGIGKHSFRYIESRMHKAGPAAKVIYG